MFRPTLNRFLLLLACAGLAMYIGVNALYNFHAGGTQTNDDQPLISKQEAAEAAAKFVQERYRLDEPQTFVVYQSQKTLSGYLQKEKLADAYERSYDARFPIDYYQVEVTESGSGRHVFVDVNERSGAVFGWTELLGAKAAAVDDAEAKALARGELGRQGLRPADFQLVSAAGERPLRYESRADAVGSARLQVEIGVGRYGQQAEITGFQALFSIPAAHQAWLDEQDASASLMTWTSMGFSLLMTAAAIAYTIRHRRRVDFSKGVLLTTIFTTIYIVNNINMYPAFKTMAGTGTSGGAVLFGLLFMNVVTLLLGASLYISLAAGKAWWDASGRSLWPSWQEKRFGRDVYDGMGRGYLLALFVLGVQQVLFYIGEMQFEVWSVNDPADSVRNMLAPGLFPLMAWAASISEEAVYRLLGIALFRKLFRSNFIAILLPSVIWAASHTQYPIYPVYTRLIEVTVIGIILGYVFLKYGFITALFTHACMDSILMGMSLFGLEQPGQTALGIVYIALPALVALALAWLHGKRRNPLIPGEPPPRLEVM